MDTQYFDISLCENSINQMKEPLPCDDHMTTQRKDYKSVKYCTNSLVLLLLPIQIVVSTACGAPIDHSLRLCPASFSDLDATRTNALELK